MSTSIIILKYNFQNNNKINSTMKKVGKKIHKTQKVNKKQKRRQQKQYESQQQQSILDLEENDPNLITNTNKNFIETPEQKRIRLAKQLIEDVKASSKAKKINDDFFIVEDENQFKKVERDDHDELENLLKEDYLKKNNLYFNKIANKIKTTQWDQPIIYKGHTKAITAIQVLQNSPYFYSCSKDGSIIKWDKQTKKKQFISYGKQPNHHNQEILCMALNSQGTILATGSTDSTIKLWDTQRNVYIDTLKSHRSDINGLKFGRNSNNLCSVSSDRTFKLWDGAQRVYIDSFYGHREQVLDIDCINANDFITSGYDNQVITWKTEKETQVVYSGHDYSIDRVRMINQQYFLTASQDNSVFLWNTKRKKPIYKFHNAHGQDWICSLGNMFNSDAFATGAYNDQINLYEINEGFKGITKIHTLPCKGIVTDIKMLSNGIYFSEAQEHRLGRWITKKEKNQIKFFKF